MKKLTKRLTALVFIVAIGFGTYGLIQYRYLNPSFDEKRTPLKYFWVYPRDLDYGLDIVENHTDQIDIISPTLYGLNGKGGLKSDWLEQDPNEHEQTLIEFVERCNAQKVSVIPMIGTGETENIRALLENQTAMNQFMDNIRENLTHFGFSGVNIDFEHLDEDLGDDFLFFFQNLKDTLPENSTLSVDLPALTKNIKSGWGAWVDYQKIGNISDQVMIMTYDNHGGWSAPGELAPISWVKRVLAYSTKEIPLEKLFIGIPRYGYDWSEDESWENWGYGYSFFQERYEIYGGTKSRTEDGYEIKYQYEDGDGYQHVAYYCDANTTWHKEDFLKNYPVAGYCYWHLASGDPRYF